MTKNHKKKQPWKERGYRDTTVDKEWLTLTIKQINNQFYKKSETSGLHQAICIPIKIKAVAVSLHHLS